MGIKLTQGYLSWILHAKRHGTIEASSLPTQVFLDDTSPLESRLIDLT